MFGAAETSSAPPEVVAVIAPRVSLVNVASPAVVLIVPPPRPTVTAPKVCEAANPALPRRLKLPPATVSVPPAAAPTDISEEEFAAMPET